MRVDFTRRSDLFERAIAQQSDAIGEGHCFFLVVRDEKEGDANFSLQSLQFTLHLFAQIGVERRERLIEQEKLRAVHQCAGERDALLLTTAQPGGAHGSEFGHLDHVQGSFDAAGDFLFRNTLDAQTVGHVVARVEMWKQSVVLKDSVYAAFVGRQLVQSLAGHPDFPGRRLFEAGDEAQKRSFSGAAFAEQSEKFSGSDVQRNVIENVANAKAFGNCAHLKQRSIGVH